MIDGVEMCVICSALVSSENVWLACVRCMCDVSAKDARMREIFEKVFPELKKQREDKERILG